MSGTVGLCRYSAATEREVEWLVTVFRSYKDWRTVQKAKKNLNIEAIRMNGAWYWRFPSSPEPSEEEMEEDDD